MDETPHDFLLDGLNEHTQVQPTLDHLAERLNGSVYVEDLQGRLLYTSSRAAADGWRTDFTPFSQGEHPRREALLAEWQDRLGLYRSRSVDLSLKEYRVLSALTYQGDLLAFVHLVSPEPRLVPLATNRSVVKAIGDKLYIVIIGSMNAIRRKHLAHKDSDEAIRHWPRQTPTGGSQHQAMAVHFGQMNTAESQLSIIDYASVAVHHSFALIDRLALSGLVAHVLHPGDNVLQCRVVFEYRDPGVDWTEEIEHGLQRALESAGWRATVGLGGLFTDVDEAADKVQEADEIRQLGSKQQSGRLVHSQRDIGIDAFLLPLTHSSELRTYARNLVDALDRKDHILLETLQVYIGLDCNATHTAEHFRVDRCTVAYRLNRISQTLGLDLNSFENKVLAYLALKAVDPKLH